MSLFKNHSDLLDEAVSQVADEPIDPRQIEEAAARVWARLSQEMPPPALPIRALRRPPLPSSTPPAASTAATISSR